MSVRLLSEQIREAKQRNVQDIVNGKYLDTYSEWLLTGDSSELLKPKVSLSVHPDIFYVAFDSKDDLSPEKLFEYKNIVRQLKLPENVLQLEKVHYQSYVDEGDSIVSEVSKVTSLKLLPTVIILFSEPKSTMLICPTIVPPSAALRFVQKNTPRILTG